MTEKVTRRSLLRYLPLAATAILPAKVAAKASRPLYGVRIEWLQGREAELNAPHWACGKDGLVWQFEDVRVARAERDNLRDAYAQMKIGPQRVSITVKEMV